MTEQDLIDQGAVEVGLEILEGLEEIIGISPDEDKRVLHKVAFMIETFLEKDYNVTIENRLDS